MKSLYAVPNRERHNNGTPQPATTAARALGCTCAPGVGAWIWGMDNGEWCPATILRDADRGDAVFMLASRDTCEVHAVVPS